MVHLGGRESVRRGVGRCAATRTRIGAPRIGTDRRVLLVGWRLLYLVVGVLVVARLLLYPLRPADLTPPYWVAMGATAITVLAGARIIEMVDAPMVPATRGLIAGASVVFWVFGTWLIPPLVAGGGVWRHVVHRVPLRYEATQWSICVPARYVRCGRTLPR